jgi:hypothetical protein
MVEMVRALRCNIFSARAHHRLGIIFRYLIDRKIVGRKEFCTGEGRWYVVVRESHYFEDTDCREWLFIANAVAEVLCYK